MVFSDAEKRPKGWANQNFATELAENFEYFLNELSVLCG